MTRRRKTMTRGMKAIALLGAALGLACTDDLPTLPGRPSFEIMDGAHSGGNRHFYFLPPLVSAPSPTGTFDASQLPEVRICAGAGGACGAVVADFTMTDGSGSETVRVNTTDQEYAVNWHTDRFDLDPALTYRVRVLVESTELGHVDVDLVSSGKELKNVNTGEFIPLLDGRTLPIKFRIEQGAVDAGRSEERRVGKEGRSRWSPYH